MDLPFVFLHRNHNDSGGGILRSVTAEKLFKKAVFKVPERFSGEIFPSAVVPQTERYLPEVRQIYSERQRK